MRGVCFVMLHGSGLGLGFGCVCLLFLCVGFRGVGYFVFGVLVGFVFGLCFVLSLAFLFCLVFGGWLEVLGF